MATIKWFGTTSSVANVAANWGGALPTSSDVVSFAGTVSNPCDMTTLGNQTYQQINITADFSETVIFDGQTITLTDGIGLVVQKAKVLSCTDATFDFTGTPDGDAYNDDGSTTNQPKYTIAINSTNDSDLDTESTGMFRLEADRQATTFVFKNSSASLSMYLMNGVYPNMTFQPTAATTLDTRNAYEVYTSTSITTLSSMNKYGKVSMLNLDVSDTDITVQAGSRTYSDLNKIYKIKGAITGIGSSVFDWGYATLELQPTANSTLPTTGNTSFGPTTELFNAHYHKLVIDESATGSYYYKIAANQRLYCNELVVNGRLYGEGDYEKGNSVMNTAEIHTVKSPSINGDWNFQQVSDGIYRVRGTKDLLPTAYGGTGVRSAANGTLLIGNGRGFSNASLISGSGIEVSGGAGSITLKPIHPLYYVEGSLDTNTDVAFNIPNEVGGAAPTSMPVPFAGTVMSVSMVFSGTISGSALDTFTIRKIAASDSSTTDKDFAFNANTLNNNNSKIVSGSDVALAFSAGDKIQFRRKSGTTDLNNAQAVVWVQFD